jgi:hypothetical protein
MAVAMLVARFVPMVVVGHWVLVVVDGQLNLTYEEMFNCVDI